MDALQPGGALGDVEVALDPAELEGLDEAGVRALYEQRLEEQRAAHSREARPTLGLQTLLRVPSLSWKWGLVGVQHARLAFALCEQRLEARRGIQGRSSRPAPHPHSG